MRWEEKIQNGKLVCIEVWPKNGKAGRVKITGDFFLHPEDAIEKIESSLSGVPLDSIESDIQAIVEKSLAESNAQFIGVSSADIARIFRKAVSG
jgi:lipoate-protein ligase A